MQTPSVPWHKPLQFALILLLAAVAMPLHEMGHWLWGTLIDGREQILQFTRVTNADGSTLGTLGSIFAGPLMSALLAALGSATLLFAKGPVAKLAGATLTLVMSFQRLTIYFMSLFMGMAANDEGIVAIQLGLHDWAVALPLTAIFLAATALAWKNAPVSQRLGWFATVYAAMFVFTFVGFWLDSVLFG